MATTEKALTAAEAAERAGVTKQAIFNAIQRYGQSGGARGLRATRHGLAYVIAAADFLAWMAQTQDRRESAQAGLGREGEP